MLDDQLPPESKPNRRKIIGRVCAGVATPVALLLVITLIPRAYTSPQRTQEGPSDGVTLYRGLFFGSGPFASKIPTVSKVAPHLPAEYKSLEGQIIKYIQAKDPAFFDRFAKDIQSGDRVRIAAAIKGTNQIQREALLEVTRTSKTRFASDFRALKAAPEPSPEPAKDVAVIVCLYVPVFVGLVTTRLPANLQKGLSFEQYVDEIARAVPKARA